MERGKIITAAGVSSGIDMGLTLVARMFGDEIAKVIQLAIEYDPQPPFDSGAPSKASPETVAYITELLGAATRDVALQTGVQNRAPSSREGLTVPPSWEDTGVIMDDLLHARNALEAAARGFDPSACDGDDAIARGQGDRFASGDSPTDVLGKAAKRVEDTAAYVYKNDRNAAELCQRLTGVSTGEAKRAIEVAGKLESLPATDAAMRAGTLSSRQADLIVSVAADDPSVERQLLKTAASGIVPLRDECIAVRARLGRIRRNGPSVSMRSGRS